MVVEHGRFVSLLSPPMLPRLVSLFGLVVLIALAWALSNNRLRFPWRTVLWGIGLQFYFALFILKTPIGVQLFAGAQAVVDQLNVFANEGAKMVFGPLADREQMTRVFGPANAFIFAFLISATIILISALSSLRYHWGLLQRVVAGMAWVMQKAMSGQPLNPQEQAVFDRQTALPQDPVAAMMALGAGVPGAAPGGYPQAGARQPGAQAGGQGQPYQPRDAADLRANVPVGGQYINPADGRVLTRTQ